MKKVLLAAIAAGLLSAPLCAETFSTRFNWESLKAGAQGMPSPAGRPVELARSLSDEDSLRYTVDFRVSGGQVHAKVDVSNKQLKAIQRAGGHVEIRMYAGDDAGHIKRLENLTYKMSHDKSSYTFPAAAVCSGFGRYHRYVKVAASARTSNGRPLPGIKTDWNAPGLRLKVTCHATTWFDFLFGW